MSKKKFENRKLKAFGKKDNYWKKEFKKMCYRKYVDRLQD